MRPMYLLPGSRRPTLVLWAVISLAYWPLLVWGTGGIATDGTLGHPAQTLTGPNFTIGPNLGQTRGGNLFHSFSTFDLNAGQTATFTGPSSIHDVFARVTGPDPSTIDGTLSCTISNATFFLIDPNGVMFGPDAKLDVKGSFAVTTADMIKLGSSGSFNASKPKTSVLTTAPPSAFGFLSSPPRPALACGERHSPCRRAMRCRVSPARFRLWVANWLLPRGESI